MAERSATLDIARGIGIVLVVLGHNPLVEFTKGELFRVVFSFHVPLFFFVSGVLLRADEPLGRFAASRAHAILKPYFVILGLLGLAKMAGPEWWLGLLWGTSRTLYWIPMWFLPHLFVASIAALLLLKAARSAPAQWIAIVASLAVGCVLMRLVAPRDWPWSLDLVPASAAFLLLGHRLRDAATTLRFEPLRFALALAAFAALHALFDETIDLNIRHYGQPAIATAQALLGIYLTLSLAAAASRVDALRAVLVRVGAGTLFVLVFHTYCQWKAYQVLTALQWPFGLATAAALGAGVALPILLWEAARRQRWLALALLPPRPAAR